jgi:ribose transport system substrate-binding protein
MQRRTLLSLAALTTACQKSGQRIVGVVPMGRSHVFWQSVHAGALDAAAPLGVEISWNGPANESEFNAQIQIVDSMITRRVDAICLAPIDRDALSAAVDRAAAAGIPVVIFDSPVKTDKFTAQVATDNYAAGSLAA